MGFASEVGIDLGTANVLVYIKGKGIVLNEPSVVAINNDNDEILAVGEEARQMLGRTPANIVAVRPLRDGVISDYDITERMLKYFIRKTCGSGRFFKPKIMVCVPSGVTEVEKRAVREAATQAGGKDVYLMEEPVAAAIGAGIDISKPNGTMVVDVGGGTADIAVVSFNGIVKSCSLKMAGNKFDAAIIRGVTMKYKILIGEKTAEQAKKEIANVYNPTGDVKITVKGRHLIKGLPESVEISDKDMYDFLHDSVMEIVDKIKEVFEQTPPELVGDILTNGIVLTGGGAMLKGFTDLVTEAVGAPCYVADDPIECVAKGVAKAFDYTDDLLDGFEKISLYRYK